MKNKRVYLGSVFALQWLSLWLLAVSGADRSSLLPEALVAVVMAAVGLPLLWWVRRLTERRARRQGKRIKQPFWIGAVQMASFLQAAVLARRFAHYPLSLIGLNIILAAPLVVAEYYETREQRE